MRYHSAKNGKLIPKNVVDILSDAIATAVMIKGFNDGLKWINTLVDVECMLISKQPNGGYINGKSNGFKYELEE